MVTIKRLKDCTLQDILSAWNRGFEGYFVQMEFSYEQFIKRMAQEELSAEHSILLYDGRMPVGIVLNGIREVHGEKQAWNGGTGIAPEYRGRGLGRLAIAECLRIYEQEGVKKATLEAIQDNHSAIHLYEKMRYKLVGRLMNYVCKNPILLKDTSSSYRAEFRAPAEIARLSFYDEHIPWQTQRKSIPNGEGLVMIDESGKECAYAIFQREWQEDGRLPAVYLYQLRIDAEAKLEAAKVLLESVMQLKASSLYVVNLPLGNDVMVEALKEIGFEETIGQVWMERIVVD